MKLWIVTIGSSDVQLDSDKVTREKGRTEKQRSDKVWRDWYDDIKPDCYDISFVPKTAFSDLEETYRIPSRVLGTVYEENAAEVQEEIWSYLTFPLLSNFIESKKESKEESKILDGLGAIVYLLTDQSAIFHSDEERRKPKSPYWDDTSKLQPILERYFQKEFTDEVKLIPLKLSPAEKPGLDDWDKVLALVKDELNTIKLDSEPDTVYVSHQAGTPAISSAVQFMSLARFREDVKFLVSSEYSQETKTIHNSTYLGALQRQEAIALLEQHDYAAVKSLLNDLDDETKILLEAAIQWNYAKFGEFANEIQKLSDQAFVQEVNARSQYWWWTPYEAAYLAVIRLKQGNTVEAFFHSFRAVEGAFLEWGKEEFKSHIKINNDRAYLQPSILCDPKDYFKDAKINPDKPEKNNSLGNLKLKFQELDNRLNNQEKNNQKPKGELLYGTTLYRLFETQKPGYKNMPEYKRFSDQDGIGEKRNKNFHQLQGLTEQDVYRDWEVNNLEEWEERILKYLNFIAKPDLPQEFTSLEEGSLMSKVHEKLVNTIASYQPE
jgi:hypothetical protein